MGRLATQGYAWGYDPRSSATMVAGRGESFGAKLGTVFFTAPAPDDSSDNVRCFRGYFTATPPPLGSGTFGQDYIDLAHELNGDWQLILHHDGTLYIQTTLYGTGSISGVPNGQHVDVSAYLDGAWHLLEVGQRFGADGYFGVRIDGTLIFEDAEYDADHTGAGSPRDYRFTDGSGTVVWTDLAVNDDTWIGPGKTVLATAGAASGSGSWVDGTSFLTAQPGTDVPLVLPGFALPECEVSADNEFHDTAQTGGSSVEESLNNVPPIPVYDYQSELDGDYGQGKVAAQPGSLEHTVNGWKLPDGPGAAPGTHCFGHEWAHDDTHEREGYGTVSDSPTTLDMSSFDTSAVTGEIAWVRSMMLVGEAAYLITHDPGTDVVDIWLTRDGESAPSSGATNFLHVRDKAGTGNTPQSFPELYIDEELPGGLPSTLTLTRNGAGGQILEACAAGLIVDCEHVAQDPLPEHEAEMWIA